MMWERTPDGVIVPSLGISLNGEFSWRVNSGPVLRKRNLLTDEGLTYLIDTFAIDSNPPPTFFIGLYANDVSPDVSWDAATFTSTSGEIVSTGEGYIEAARQAWSPSQSGAVYGSDLSGLPAEFNLRTSTTLTLCGFGVLTDSTWGGTSGVLLSAIRFDDAPASYDDHDILDVFYRIEAIRL